VRQTKQTIRAHWVSIRASVSASIAEGVSPEATITTAAKGLGSDLDCRVEEMWVCGGFGDKKVQRKCTRTDGERMIRGERAYITRRRGRVRTTREV